MPRPDPIVASVPVDVRDATNMPSNAGSNEDASGSGSGAHAHGARRLAVASGSGGDQPTSDCVPRLTSWSATISRWISLVPSQMRSTRTSRQKRSATFSRM
jgi:hypothetical protein